MSSDRLTPQPDNSSSSAATTAVLARHQLRQVINLITLATPLGLGLARMGKAHLSPGPEGTVIALNYRSRFPAPHASAVTIGNVILVRLDARGLAARPQLLAHEIRHTTQWACGLGTLGFPLAYGCASLWSLIRCGNAAHRNIFERLANLADGGYVNNRNDNATMTRRQR